MVPPFVKPTDTALPKNPSWGRSWAGSAPEAGAQRAAMRSGSALKGQASPIVVMLLASVVVILGLGLIGYVVSLISSQQARTSLYDYLLSVQSSTYVYVESVWGSGSTYTVDIGVINIGGEPLRYELLVVPVDWSLTGFTLTSVAVRDPYYSLLNPVTVDCGRVYVFERGYADVAGLYGLAACQLYTLRYIGGRPHLVEMVVQVSEPRPLLVIVMVEVEGNYYEVGRLVVKLPV